MTRNFLSFADLAPGVAFDTAANTGQVKLQSGAQNRDNVNVFIDGVEPEELRAAGGITGQDSTPRQPVPAVGDRRVQGDHAELQGRVRPGEQRGDHRRHR